MAGKKKKSLANKLAKMSDEERARYLQHKADMEEEARRRKEQLIATFLKKKIKKEEIFSRLNLAKINQSWHQILRKAKCQEMKENVDHMRNWIERVLNYKNRTISKLMEELEEAEEQYLNNFQAHSTHIDIIIEHQHLYIGKLQKQYDDDLNKFLETSRTENDFFLKNAKDEEEYLQTVLFGQETEGKKVLKDSYESYMQKLYETEKEFKEKMKRLTKSREGVSGAIWKQIAAVVRLYVQQTDFRRMHLAELRRLDTESAVEISENEERIRREEELIKTLRRDHEVLLSKREVKIKNLDEELDGLNIHFLKIKKNLHRELQVDEKKLKLLSDTSKQSLICLENLAYRGEQIKHLALTCTRFQTDRENAEMWLPHFQVLEPVADRYGGDKDVNLMDLRAVGTAQIFQDSELPNVKYPSSAARASKLRPKTAISGRSLKSAKSITDTSTPESRRITTVNNIILQAKPSQEAHTSSPSISPPSSSLSNVPPPTTPNILERCFESLKNMENFWFTFNKVEVDYLEVKEEKRVLERENKQLRGMIRAVLETAALAQSIPSTRVPTRVGSKKRGAHSAPFRRVAFA